MNNWLIGHQILPMINMQWLKYGGPFLVQCSSYLEVMFCSACGSLVDQNANFCKDCGKMAVSERSVCYCYTTYHLNNNCWPTADQLVFFVLPYVLPWVDFVLPWIRGVLPWVTFVLPWINGVLPWVNFVLPWINGVLRELILFCRQITLYCRELSLKCRDFVFCRDSCGPPYSSDQKFKLKPSWGLIFNMVLLVKSTK